MGVIYVFLLPVGHPKIELKFHTPVCTNEDRKAMHVTCGFVHVSQLISSSIHLMCGSLSNIESSKRGKLIRIGPDINIALSLQCS